MGNSFSTNVLFTSKHLKIATGVALSSILLTSFAKKVHDIYVDEENDGTEEIDNDNEVIIIKDKFSYFFQLFCTYEYFKIVNEMNFLL